jgi:hypothetical protein
MHRSGTSLAASCLAAAGLSMGDRLHPPGRGNPRGHFEDRDFFEFHVEFLARRAVSVFDVPPSFSAEATAAEREQALQIVADREARAQWGFKDPRTVLLLDFWDSILPEARYLFLYRHPVDVAISLLRRNLDPEVRADVRAAVRSWQEYNRRILAFAARRPDRCLVLPASTLLHPKSWIADAARRWDLDLDSVAAEAVVVPEDLSISMAASEDWSRTLPTACELLRQLDDIAGAPSERQRPVDGLQEPAELPLFRQSMNLLRALEDAGVLDQGFVDLGKLDVSQLTTQLADARHAVRALAEWERVEATWSFRALDRWWRLRRGLKSALRRPRTLPPLP